LLASSALGAVGMYTPLFCLSHQLAQEEEDVEEGSLLLLHIWLGVATTVGCLLAGLITTSTSSEYFISRKLLLQLSHYMGAIAMFCFYCVAGFHGLAVVAWIYGIALGIFLYTSKMFCYSVVRSKEFSRVWSVVQGVQAVPCLVGVSLTGYINSQGSKTGYWLSLVSLVAAGALLNLIPSLHQVTHQCVHPPPHLPTLNPHTKVQEWPDGETSNSSRGPTLSQSHPDLRLPLWHYQDANMAVGFGLKRQNTWHRLLSPQDTLDLKKQDTFDLNKNKDVIDQITSTV